MSANGMVRLCFSPTSERSWQGQQTQGARRVTETQQRSRRDRHRYRFTAAAFQETSFCCASAFINPSRCTRSGSKLPRFSICSSAVNSGHQARVVAKRLQLAAEMMRADAGFRGGLRVPRLPTRISHQPGRRMHGNPPQSAVPSNTGARARRSRQICHFGAGPRVRGCLVGYRVRRPAMHLLASAAVTHIAQRLRLAFPIRC
jgi:hypothetical protein